MRRRWIWAPLAVLLIAWLVPIASASPNRSGRMQRSRSIGLPWDGRLDHGVLLRESRTVRYTGEYRDAGNFYGTFQLVQLLERAAERVNRRLPGGKLSVGELSRRAGGPITGHASHESGRDVDIAFYMTDAEGEPYEPYAFASFDANGVGTGPNRMLRFDTARNWELIGRLVADPDARVQHIFVSTRVRAHLLREARRRHATPRVIERAARVMAQPTAGNPHRNHFHVRIYCDPRERPRCEDNAPYHAWYPGTPPIALR